MLANDEKIPVLILKISLFVIISFVLLLVFEGSLSANLLSREQVLIEESEDFYESSSRIGDKKIYGDIPLNESKQHIEVQEKKTLRKKITDWFKKESDIESERIVGQYRGMIQFISGLIVVYRPDVQNAGELAREIVEVSISEDIDPLYIAAIISVESGFSTTAKSKAGARGLMQLMPATAQEVSEKITGEKKPPKLNDPRTNILLGIRYIKQLHRKYHNKRFYALAAYNWGPGNVDKALSGEIRIPDSVSEYAKKIVLRKSNWNKHYFHASRGEALLLAAM